MKIKCSFPDCTNTHEVSILNWLFGSLLARTFKWYLCEEHRFTEEEWDDLYVEMKKMGKIS